MVVNHENENSLQAASDPPPHHQQQEEFKKQLGRKARERFVEEREKRPEIVRINEVLLPPPPQPRTTATKEKNNNKSLQHQQQSSIAITAKKPSQPRKKRMRSSSTHPKETAGTKNVDRWLPDMSLLQTTASSSSTTTTTTTTGNSGIEDQKRTTTTKKQKQQQEGSNVVWLHGLPTKTTPGQIRRFFSGLNPRRIMILPSNPIRIPQWDANHEKQPSSSHKRSNKKKMKDRALVERYQPETMRVLVEFATARTADMATKRSGEAIMLSTPSSSPTDDDDDDDDCTGSASFNACALGVTQVIKPVAAILKQMGIDGEKKKNIQLLERILNNVEKQIDPVVSRILWSAVARDHNLLFEVGGGEKDDEFYYPLEKYSILNIPDLEQVVERRKILVDDYERLMYTPPFSSCYGSLDPELAATDPVVRLTSKASEILLKEIQQTDQCILQARRWSLLNFLG